MSLRYLDRKSLFTCTGSTGFTFVELLVAMGIGAMVAAGAVMVLSQIFILVPKAENNMLAIRQAQNAGSWIDRDAKNAQFITPTPNLFTVSTATPLVISYVNWNSENTTVTYSVDAAHKLQRQIIVKDKNAVTISSNQIQVADSIASITAQYNQPDINNPRKILTVTIIAQVGSSSETRVFEISPRTY